jgi:lysyl-tRNA synthetase class 1
VEELPLTFGLMLKLASAANAEDKAVLWRFIERYAPGTSPETHPTLDQLAGYAVRYFIDRVKPRRAYRLPDEVEASALAALDAALEQVDGEDRDAIQNAVLDVGRAEPRYQDHKRKSPTGGPGVTFAWFSALYELLLGEKEGPRFGSFVAAYGIPETRALIARALAGELAKGAA